MSLSFAVVKILWWNFFNYNFQFFDLNKHISRQQTGDKICSFSINRMFRNDNLFSSQFPITALYSAAKVVCKTPKTLFNWKHTLESSSSSSTTSFSSSAEQQNPKPTTTSSSYPIFWRMWRGNIHISIKWRRRKRKKWDLSLKYLHRFFFRIATITRLTVA